MIFTISQYSIIKNIHPKLSKYFILSMNFLKNLTHLPKKNLFPMKRVIITNRVGCKKVKR